MGCLEPVEVKAESQVSCAQYVVKVSNVSGMLRQQPPVEFVEAVDAFVLIRSLGYWCANAKTTGTVMATSPIAENRMMMMWSVFNYFL